LIVELTFDEALLLARLKAGDVRLMENRFREAPPILQPLVNRNLVTATLGRKGLQTWWSVKLTQQGKTAINRWLDDWDEPQRG
jgi:hypothetical protein